MTPTVDNWDDDVAFACRLPDYEGWNALLVRFGSAAPARIAPARIAPARIAPARIANVICRAWWDLAKKPQRQLFGARP